MIRTAIISCVMILFMSGCTAYRNDSLQLMHVLPEHHSHFDAQLAWQVTSTDDSTVVSGAIKNIRYYRMTNLEVWVYTLDDSGKEVGRGMDFVEPLQQDEAGPFSIKLPRLDSGTRLKFQYNYVGLEDEGASADAVDWSETFESRVP